MCSVEVLTIPILEMLRWELERITDGKDIDMYKEKDLIRSNLITADPCNRMLRVSRSRFSDSLICNVVNKAFEIKA